jgi:hypothetical protein
MGHTQSLYPDSKDLESPARQPLHPQDVEPEKKKPWAYYLWDTFDKPKEERWFMFKLDTALLTFASLGK